jgi:hypothetical protein
MPATDYHYCGVVQVRGVHDGDGRAGRGTHPAAVVGEEALVHEESGAAGIAIDDLSFVWMLTANLTLLQSCPSRLPTSPTIAFWYEARVHEGKLRRKNALESCPSAHDF